MSKLSVDLPSVLVALDSAEATAAKLAKGVSDAQANWQPLQGRSWSVNQCFDHLVKLNLIYAAAMHDALDTYTAVDRRPTSKIEPGWFGKWFIVSMDAPARRKFKTPSKVAPAFQGNLATLVSQFAASHSALRDVIRQGEKVDLNRVHFKNPFVSSLRIAVGTGLLVINAHDRRHLWQAEEVKKSEGYPNS